MAEKSSPERRTVTRRSVVVGGTALVAGTALNAVLPQTAEAQGLVPTAPPESLPIVPSAPEQKPQNPKPASDVFPIRGLGTDFVENRPIKEEELDVREGLKRQVKIGKNFLLTPEGETPPDIAINYSDSAYNKETEIVALYKDRVLSENPKKITIQEPKITVNVAAKDKKPVSQLILEAGEQIGLLIKDSNRNKDLATNFALAFQKYGGVNLYSFGNDMLSEDQMVRISNASPFFEFSNYTDGIPRGNLFKNRKDLPTTLLVKAMAVWMSESDQLSQKLDQAPANDGAQMANVFLFALKLMDNCANSPEAFNSLGIKKATLENIVNLSGNEQFKQHFKGKGV